VPGLKGVKAVKLPASVNGKCVAPNIENTTLPEFEHCSPSGFEDCLPLGFNHSVPPLFDGCVSAEFNYCSPPGFEDLRTDYVILCAFRIHTVLEMQWRRYGLSVCFDQDEHKGTPRRQVWRFSLQFFPLDLPGKMSTVLDLRFGLFPSRSTGFQLTLQFCCSSYTSDTLKN